MRQEILLHQVSPETIQSLPNPMRMMQLCQEMCAQVPEEVCDALFDSFQQVSRADGGIHEREARAAIMAPRMASEGWRFCPCFPEKRTERHAQIFAMVHTNMANRLAHRAVLELGRGIENQSAA
jgi:hypothetical protein